MAARSWWLLLVAMGPLVGVSFIAAVQTYAELSGLNGTAAGVGEAFSPLVGIWAPTFSACELAAAFLLPFVAIRVVAEDRVSGALKLELQRPLHPTLRIGAKALVLLGGWLLLTCVPLTAVLLWRTYGGPVFVGELLSVVAGHMLNAAVTIALASAAAMITDHPSTAAIATLAITVGTWILNFVAAIHGGIWQRAAEYTPTAMVAEFQHGLVRLDVLLAALAIVVTGLGLAAIWMRIGVAVRRRTLESAAVCAALCVALALSATVRGAWDASANRMNSFSRADERALRTIEQPLRITAYLAPEDPRRTDLDRNAISKLRRIVRDFGVTYVSATSTGLFEQTREHYGEIHYQLGGRQVVGRAVTTEAVLDSVYSLVGETPAQEPDEEERETTFRGHPLPARPAGAALVFYGGWPAVAVLAALRSRRRGS
jgi:hypothetical protein